MYKPIYNNISLYFSGVSRLTITDSGEKQLYLSFTICICNMCIKLYIIKF